MFVFFVLSCQMPWHRDATTLLELHHSMVFKTRVRRGSCPRIGFETTSPIQRFADSAIRGFSDKGFSDKGFKDSRSGIPD